MSELFVEAKQAIIDTDKDKALAVAQRFLDGGGDPLEIISQGFVPGITQVGEQFGRGTLFLPELILAAEVMMAVTDILSKEMSAKGNGASTGPEGSILVATVKGDVHDIGKGIAVAMFKANGYTVYDLGRDVEVDDIINGAEKNGLSLIHI